ncbi:MAG: hypothetical protein VKL20_00345 [Synechocystis sp.]|nr:hypothetical protein [Synechocystis sp.]
MSALPKSATYARHRRLDRSKVKAPTTLTSPQQQLPTALQVLLGFQQATSLITFGVVGIVLGVYGWTVYTPLQWSQEYQQLKALQKTERQLIANTEAIKHQLAQEADRPSSGLVNPSPDQNIFLPTKQSDMIAPKAQPIAANHPSLSFTVKPIAY